MTSRTITKFFVFGFATYGVLWTIAESYGAFFEDQKPQGVLWYVSIVAVSLIAGSIKSRSRQSVTIHVASTDSSIELTFGDLFDGTEPIVIPVNEFFDGSLGDHVSTESLHGKFIRDHLGGESSTFNRLTSTALASVPSEGVQRPNGRKNRYPIGTVATIDVNDRRIMLAALTRTNTDTLKSSATLHELWDCLAGVWGAIRDRSNGKTVSLPLIGSGLSGVGLPANNLIQITITSFIYYTKKSKVAEKVRLVLPQHMRGKISLEPHTEN